MPGTKLLALMLVFSLSGAAAWAPSANGQDALNVLFIAVDDLRPELNCYGKTHMHTPNMDRLAARGTLFEKAYCMVPTCGASRASMMTGIRPTPTRFINHLSRADEDAPNATTMNSHFKQHGYTTASLGKVFHHPQDSNKGWSRPAWRQKHSPGRSYYLPENVKKRANAKNVPGKKNGPAYEIADVPDDQYPDAEVAAKAIRRLKQLKHQGNPWFMVVGFYRPHLPFVVPKKYWDLYPRDTIRLPENNYIPEHAPQVSIHNNGELRHYTDIPQKGPVSKDTAINLIRGYYASVSFVDAQIGRVVQALNKTGQSDNTIIVLWSDHGWNLLEHTLWQKHSCYETSLQIPLIVAVPGKDPEQRSPALIESIDLYPTLCELTGIPTPEHTQGTSFVPLLDNPLKPWKTHAVSRIQQGDSIRTQRYRYTNYTKNGKHIGHMLYDHDTDPQENVSIVKRPEMKSTAEHLKEQLDGVSRIAEQATE